MTKTWVVEYSTIMGDASHDYDTDRQGAEDRARRLSLKPESEGVCYVVAIDAGERVGHRVLIHGRIDRTEGAYL